MKKTYICQECGKNFERQNHSKRIIKYCSKECMIKAHKKRNANKHKRTCIVCGNEFQQELLKCGRYSNAKTCSLECSIKLSEQTCLKKYGVKNASQNKEIKAKKEETCFEHYNVKYPKQSQEIKEKSYKTCLERYGTKIPSQVEEFKEKAKQTFNEHYDNQARKTGSIRLKTIETNLKKYNAPTPFENENIKQNFKNKMLEKYGVENPSQAEEIKNKRIKTMLDKFGAEVYSKSDDYKNKIDIIINKCLNTKRKNNTFNCSSKEKEIEILLKERFPNLKTQYKSEEYPFLCDFYIPELNLYIEYQGHFSHGFKPFVGTENDLKKLYNWQEKVKQGKPSYKQAIETWTIRDPLKRKIVKENNLNWLEFFNMNDFIEWYKKG